MIDGGTNNMYYIHKDYLGSYESITDDNGVLLERHSFDPWGRRRNPSDWTFTGIPGSNFDRGYTGHQHMGGFELINMNGRVYDPWLGRFLSPDPFVQAPTYSQNYNRYSYALNNPLKYVDPSGYNYGPPIDFKLGRGAFAPKTSPFYINNYGIIQRKNTQMFMNMGNIEEAGHFETFVQATDWFTEVTTSEGKTKKYNYTEYEFTTEWVWNETDWGYSSWRMRDDGLPPQQESVYRKTAWFIRNSPVLPNPTSKLGMSWNPFYQAEALFFDAGLTWVSAEGDGGVFFILAGEEAGKIIPYVEGAFGPASEFGVGIEIGRVDITGDPNTFKSKYLDSHRDKFWVNIAPTGGLWSVGVSAAWSTTKYGRTIIMSAFQAGIGQSAFMFWGAGLNRGRTYLNNPFIYPK